MLFHSSANLDVVTIVRSYEIRAYEQQDQSCLFEMRINLASEFGSHTDFSIVPISDHRLTLQCGQVGDQPASQFFVFVSVRKKNFNRSIGAQCHSRVVSLKIILAKMTGNPMGKIRRYWVPSQ